MSNKINIIYNINSEYKKALQTNPKDYELMRSILSECADIRPYVNKLDNKTLDSIIESYLDDDNESIGLRVNIE